MKRTKKCSDLKHSNHKCHILRIQLLLSTVPTSQVSILFRRVKSAQRVDLRVQRRNRIKLNLVQSKSLKNEFINLVVHPMLRTRKCPRVRLVQEKCHLRKMTVRDPYHLRSMLCLTPGASHHWKNRNQGMIRSSNQILSCKNWAKIVVEGNLKDHSQSIIPLWKKSTKYYLPRKMQQLQAELSRHVPNSRRNTQVLHQRISLSLPSLVDREPI